ncbi:oligosaccharide flippase family protein [Priestia megaterium]|uniref:oligosaccharide flippase family protein n=1 Tax=Priestia megaterium TaxID=1404 RepID=UPI002E21CF32|nr:oligosaccharide flippase family protein [Priestia megaterium]MED4288145.1 oligosaccharide flippase family protein [Priestia megaterium]
MSSTTKNIFYVILQQFILLFLPLLTIPYVSRILGPSGVGVISYSTSIVMLFINLALLGSELYGVKETAKVKEDKKQLSHIFSEIFFIRLSLLLLATIIYFTLAYFYFDYKFIFYLQAINLFAYMIDINWFFQGIEQFKKILYRNILIKTLGFISVFIFVKSKDDLYLYVIILSLSILIGNGFMWLNLKSIVGSFKRVTTAKIKYHSISMLSLFMAGFSIMIYILTDKIMLGIFSSTTEVGLYEQGQKIINVLVTIVTAFSAVMLPKAAQIIKNGKMNQVSALINQSISIISFIVLPICTIFLLVSANFMPWFLGEGFEKSTIISQLLTPIIFIKAIGVMLGSTYFIPMEKNKEYTLPLVVGAVINIILNLILIPYYGAIGSAIATLFTELMIFIVQLIFLGNIISYASLFKNGFLKYVCANMVIVIIVMLCKTIININSNFFNIVLYGVMSGLIYIIMMIVLKDKYIKSVLNMVLSKISSKQKGHNL